MRNSAYIFSFFFIYYNILSNNVILAILGGRETQPNEFKYIVSIQNSSEHLCGGALLSNQYVLTAAHCVIMDDNSFRAFPLTVIAGVNDLHADPETKVVIEVERIYVSLMYNQSHWFHILPEYDVAVLRLKNKLDIAKNPGLGLIELPSKSVQTGEYNSFTHKITQLAGFGYDYLEQRNTSDDQFDYFGNRTGLLRKAKVYVFNNSEYNAVFLPAVQDNQFTAIVVEHDRTTPQGGCNGDSGSPLVYKNSVVGIFSGNAPGCNDNRIPTFYTKVSPYITFIKECLSDLTEGKRVATLKNDSNI